MGGGGENGVAVVLRDAINKPWGGGGTQRCYNDDDELMLNVLRCHLTY